MNTKSAARRTLIDMARRLQRPGSGSSAAFLQRRTTIVTFPDLTSVLVGVPWAFIGAAATRLYMPERYTQDLGILVHSRDLATVEQRLLESGFRRSGPLTVGGSSWTTADGFAVDVVTCAEEWCSEALLGAAANLDAHGNPVIPLAFLVLTKFRAGRVQDLADCTRMLGLAGEDQIESVRQTFRRWLPDELNDLESLIVLGRLESEG